MSCIQNPQVGFEARPAPAQCRQSKRVLVVGAGPAGLEAARCAAQRGHSVKLFEKGSDIGGQTRLHQLAAGRAPIFALIRYLAQSLKTLRVPIITGIEMDAAAVIAEKPDAVIIATGSRPVCHPFPGTYGPPHCLDVWQVLTGSFPVGEKILFIDAIGNHYSTAVAEWLADQGKQIDLVTCDLFVGVELAPLGDLYLARQRLLQKGVVLKTDITVQRIEANRVWATELYTQAEVDYHGYQTIVLAAGNQAEEDIYHQLNGCVAEIYRVGDCVAPRGIEMAVFEGRRVGEIL